MSDFEKKQSILLVDDDPNNLDILSNTLSGFGYEVSMTMNGKAALNSLRTQIPDLILLDIRMPDMDGFEVCRRLKAQEHSREIPVIFVSVIDDAVDKAKGFHLGAVDYITKPFESWEILARVKTHLTIRNTQSRLEVANRQLLETRDELKQLNATLEERVDQRTAELQAANKALRESEERLRQVVEHMPMMMDALDEHSNVIVWNRECERVTGYSAEEMVGNPRSLETLYPDTDYREQMIAELVDLGFDFRDKEYTLTCKDGTAKTIGWFNISARIPIPGWYTWGIGVDVTERKRTEEALQEGETKFRSIVESSPMGMHMYHLESDDRLVFVGANRAADQILGVDNSQFIGKAIEEAFPPLVNTKIPDYYRRAAAQGEPWVTEQIDYKDEKIAGAYEVHAFQTEPGKMVAMFLDITGRKQAEEALRESEEHYRALFEYLPIPAFTKNYEGQYTSCNAENQRYWAVDPIGRTDNELLDHETAAELRESDLYVMESGETLTVEEHLTDTSLGERHVLSRKVPLRDGRGNTVGILGASIDITERKQAEKELKKYRDHLEELVEERTADLTKANEQLRHSEERLTLAIVGTGGALWEEELEPDAPFGDQFGMVYYSPGGQQLLGYEEGNELAPHYKAWYDHILSEDQALVRQRQREHFEGHTDYLDHEYRVRLKDGSIHWVHGRNCIMRDERGRPIRWIGIDWDITERKKTEEELRRYREHLEELVEERTAELHKINEELEQEITERKQAEEALRESEEHYRALFESLPIPTFTKNREGEYTSCNTESLRYWTVNPIGRTDVELLGGEAATALREADLRVMETGATLTLEEYLTNTLLGERHVLSRKEPLRDGSGTIVGILGASIDITERKRVEKALRESQANLSALIENTDGSIWSVDRDYHLVVGNSVFHQNVCAGRGRPFAPGENVLADNSVAAVLDEWRGYYDRALRGERFSVETQRRFVYTPGHYIEYRFSPIHAADRSVSGVTVFGRDITERKRVEEALRQERDRAQKYLDIAGVMFVAINAKGEITLINQKGSEVLGCEQEEIMGKNWFDNFLPVSIKDQVSTVFDRLIACEVKPVEYYENPVVTKGGQERMIAWHNTILKDDKDNIIGTLSSGEDITDRKRAEEALRENEARFNAFMDHLPVAVFIKDAEGRTLYVNKYIEITLDAKNWLGKTADELFLQEIGQAMIADEHKALREGQQLIIEHIPGRDGVLRTYETHKFPIKQADGSLLLGGISLDMTERVRAEEEIRTLNITLEQRVAERTAQLEATNNELKDFAYIVSHDLKAPLRNVSQLSTWLIQDYRDKLDEQGKELLHLLISRVKRMSQLIDGVLEYSRIGRIHREQQLLDLRTIVHGVIDSLAPPVHIHVTVESTLPLILGDPTRIIQLFQNVIGNAIQYNDKPQGLVTIGCEDTENLWKFSVSDNGPGIEKKDYGRIFKIFQTGHRRDEIESTGVGLTVVKKIIELYGGEVWVESEIGMGSTFFFTIPKE